jgi:hypothetical protein
MAYHMHTIFLVHVTLELGDDGHEVEARIDYSVSRARPATLEEPSEEASVSIDRITIDGSDAPGWLFEMAESDQALLDELMAHAADTEEHARDRAADERREDLRMEGR